MSTPVLALGSSDAIEPPPERSLTCCARIHRDGLTGWCLLPDGHPADVEHVGAMSEPPPSGTFGPRRRA